MRLIRSWTIAYCKHIPEVIIYTVFTQNLVYMGVYIHVKVVSRYIYLLQANNLPDIY